MYGMLSDIGNGRTNNEDYIGCYEDDNKKIYIVADGLGGHNAGEIASKIAVNTVINYIKSQKKIDDLSKTLIEAINKANVEIFHLSSSNAEYQGMGTTITAGLISKGELCIANVGDSRCYVVGDNSIIKITKDHSLVQLLLDDGKINSKQALNHPNKNIITRALGIKHNVKIDTYQLELSKIRKILLCTDGLTNELSEEEIFQVLSKYEDNQVACNKLIEKCKTKQAQDNISVILFEGGCK